jgi:hypothetical protein
MIQKIEKFFNAPLRSRYIRPIIIKSKVVKI